MSLKEGLFTRLDTGSSREKLLGWKIEFISDELLELIIESIADELLRLTT